MDNYLKIIILFKITIHILLKLKILLDLDVIKLVIYFTIPFEDTKFSINYRI